MLIFRRKPGEDVIVGEGQVQIKVLGFDRGDVVLGFHAAGSIPINRAEIYVQKQNKKHGSLLHFGGVSKCKQ